MRSYLSVQEAAKRWGISVRWVNQYALDGKNSWRRAAGQILGDSGRWKTRSNREAQIRAQAERNAREKQQEGLNR